MWRKGARSPGLDGGRLCYRLRLGVELYWDQLPNPMRLVVEVILDVYLDHRYFSGGSQILP